LIRVAHVQREVHVSTMSVVMSSTGSAPNAGSKWNSTVLRVVAQRRGPQPPVGLLVGEVVLARLGERHAGRDHPGSVPRRAWSSTSRSQSSASRFAK
jgi:hypothetical protein